MLAASRSKLRLVLLLLLQLYNPAAAVSDAACVPRCNAYSVLRATVAQLNATAPGEPQGSGWAEKCRPHVRTRAGVLNCLRGKWVVIMGCSWSQAVTLALLQARMCCFPCRSQHGD